MSAHGPVGFECHRQLGGWEKVGQGKGSSAVTSLLLIGQHLTSTFADQSEHLIPIGTLGEKKKITELYTTCTRGTFQTILRKLACSGSVTCSIRKSLYVHLSTNHFSHSALNIKM
ncbi:hypothetical protein NQZ68_000445 [Dissostichus eleginoides]|nr:hypothetical protein NQZ68_000445 [Dissostichus eleginoides]